MNAATPIMVGLTRSTVPSDELRLSRCAFEPQEFLERMIMEVCLLKSKIHRAAITDGNLKYEGSLTIASDLMEKCGLIPYERIE